MQKIADFIVKKRVVVMLFMLVIAVICAFLSTKVIINEDMTSYLPDDSAMKQGMDIMSSEFPETESSQTVRVMVQDLNTAQKQEVLNILENLEYADSVDYDDSEDYNKGNQTLYIVNTEYGYGTDEEKLLEDNIASSLDSYTAVIKNDDSSVEPIPVYIMLAAVVILLAVLFTMCGSWFEPLLFLITIGIAIVINSGTNFFLGTVSNVTSMISALLQLVLSMDYSIILMNRYRQELEHTTDRGKAMSSALTHAFSSITGSSVTTIVGLLALVFMSFKIGMDLGIVLAKGVLISMLCVFTVLPGIILLFSNIIQKTAKKVPHIPMKWLGTFSYKFRIPVAIAFAAIFVGSYIMQGNTETVFTLSNEDPIAEVFPKSNAIVLVYDNEDDEAVTKLAEQLVESDEKVKSAASYSTMLGKQYQADELAAELGKMSDELDLDADMLKILYYNYYSPETDIKMTASEFLKFVSDDVLSNDMLSDRIDDEMKDKAELISEFSDAAKLTEGKSAKELAEIFGIDEELIEKMLLLYYSENDGAECGTMTLPVFADFVVNDIAKNPDYSSVFDSDTLAMTETLLTFTDAEKMTVPCTCSEIASMLGFDEETAKLLYVYYYASQADYNAGTMSMAEFANFIQNNISANPAFSGYIDADMLNQVSMLAAFTDANAIQSQKTSAELAAMLGIEQSMIEQLFMAAFPADVTDKTMTFAEFTGFLAEDILNNPAYALQFDETTKVQLTQMNQLVQLAASGTKLPAAQMAQIMGMEETQITQLYAMASIAEMSLSEFISLLTNQILPNENYAAMFSEVQKAQLQQMSVMIAAASSGQQLSPPQLAQALKMDETTVTQLFVVYYTDTTGKTMSAIQLVDFLVNNMSASLEPEMLGKLQFFQNIMNGVIVGKSYTCTEMSAMLGMDAGTLKMLYTLRNSLGDTSEWKLSPKAVIDFLTNNNSLGSLMGDNADKLSMLKAIIDSSANGTKFEYSKLAEMLGMESAQLKQLYLLYQIENGNTSDWKISIDEFVSFIKTDILSDESYASQMDAETSSLLTSAEILIDAVISGKEYSFEELADIFSGMTDELDKNTMELFGIFYGSQKNYNDEWTLSIHQMFNYIADDMMTDPLFEDFLDEDMRTAVSDNRSTIEDGIAQLKGENYSRLILNTTYSDESPETSEFMSNITETFGNTLSKEHYFIGSSVMNYEMENTFDKEMLTITLITAISIFIVVAVTFRSFIIPLILVLIVQCGVYITVTIIGIQGYSIYYLALLIVQSILMGATIDYGILYTDYYREKRRTLSVKEALVSAYDGAIHTILTSGLILILVTAIVGNLFSNPTVGQICRTISMGALSASLMILFILPGILATVDKLVIRRKKKKE